MLQTAPDGASEDVLDAAACSKAPCIRVVGAGGTGKTEACVRRVAHLLEAGVSPADVLVAASTRSAAAALARRIAECGVAGAEAVAVRVPEDVFVSVLDTPAARQATGRVPRLLADFEERILMEDMKVCGLKAKRLREMLKFFYRTWTELKELDDDFLIEDDEVLVHDAIKRHLTLRQAMLAPEVANLTYRYLAAHPDAAGAHAYAHVIVDDYQNMSRATQATLDLLAKESLMACGNVHEQVPTPEPYPYAAGFSSFEENHEGAVTYTLRASRANPARIAAMANALVLREAPDASAEAGELAELDAHARTGEAHVVQWVTPQDEFMGIARHIKHRLAGEGGVSLRSRDIFVAVPNALWGRAIARVLEANDIACDQLVSYHALKGDPRDEKKCAALRAYTLLALMADPADTVAWRSWCGFGDYLTHSNHWCRLEDFASDHGMSVVEVLESLSSFDEPPFLGADVLAARVAEAHAVIDPVRDRRGFTLLAACKEPGADALPAAFEALLEPVAGGEDARELVERARGRLEMRFADVDAVRIALPSMAVGLSFKECVIAGAVDGFFPCAEAFDINFDEDRQRGFVSQDRRCWYSVIAKASETLVVSFFQKDAAETAIKLSMQVARIRDEHGRAMAQLSPSRLVDELGPEAPGVEVGAVL